MRVLLTGSKGFTGLYLTKELKKNHIVLELEANLLNVEGLLSEIKEKKPEAVIHLAAITSVLHSRVNDIYETNIIGTRNLLTCLIDSKSSIQTIILPSSANVYGNNKEPYLSENMHVHPANDYAVSKIAMEYLANLYKDQLPITILRFFNYTGIGQSEDFLVPKIISHIKRKEKFIEVGNTEVWREFNDVRDVVEIYKYFINHPTPYETINISSGKAFSLQEIIKLASSVSGHKLTIKRNASLIRKNEVISLCGNPTKLKSIIKDLNLHSLEDTLLWMLNG